MKYLLTILLAVTLLSALTISCGKDATPLPPSPQPEPHPVVLEFVVKGKTVTIEGKLKPQAKVTVDEAKRSMQTAADLIDAE